MNIENIILLVFVIFLALCMFKQWKDRGKK